MNRILLALLLLAATGCGTTIAPTVDSRTIAFEGNEQNAGVLAIDDFGAILTERKKAHYDALVAIYGRGTPTYPITPPIVKGEGLERLRGKDAGFPSREWVWRIDGEHLTWFLAFRDWQRASREARDP